MRRPHGRRICWPYRSAALSDLYMWQHVSPFGGSFEAGATGRAVPIGRVPSQNVAPAGAQARWLGAVGAASQMNHNPGIQGADEVVPVGPAQ